MHLQTESISTIFFRLWLNSFNARKIYYPISTLCSLLLFFLHCKTLQQSLVFCLSTREKLFPFFLWILSFLSVFFKLFSLCFFLPLTNIYCSPSFIVSRFALHPYQPHMLKRGWKICSIQRIKFLLVSYTVFEIQDWLFRRAVFEPKLATEIMANRGQNFN